MTSTGNDIISLNGINITRTRQYRFYSKILSPAEKELYNQAAFATIPFESFVWLLWSIKESAYKYLKRTNPALIFIPVKFTVKQLELPNAFLLTNFEAIKLEGKGFGNLAALKSIISVGSDILYSRSLIYRELIATVVNGDEDFENTCWGIKVIDKIEPEYQSMEVRRFLVGRLQQVFRIDGLAICKDPEGIPFVLNDGAELPVAVSLSHHERLVAYSFQL